MEQHTVEAVVPVGTLVVGGSVGVAVGDSVRVAVGAIVGAQEYVT